MPDANGAAGLEVLAGKIARARCPEDLFGPLNGTVDAQLSDLRHRFHALCRDIHPDANGSSARASEALQRLTGMRDRAALAIRAGTYGGVPIATLETRNHRYAVLESLDDIGIANAYRCAIDDARPGLLAIARVPAGNDLMRAEASALRSLCRPDRPEAAGYRPMIPQLIESFDHSEAGGLERRANSFEALPGYVSIAHVREAYPAGVHPKDMAWVFRRLLDVLGYAHARGFIRGSVLPPNVLIGTGDLHEVVLTNWQSVVNAGDEPGAYIPSLDIGWEDYYPPEVVHRLPPTPGTDLLMAARCMVALLGGDPIAEGPAPFSLPASLPRRLAGFLKSCLLLAPGQRPQDAWRLRAEFTELIDLLWGRREYRPYLMPS